MNIILKIALYTLGGGAVGFFAGNQLCPRITLGKKNKKEDKPEKPVNAAPAPKPEKPAEQPASPAPAAPTEEKTKPGNKKQDQPAAPAK